MFYKLCFFTWFVLSRAEDPLLKECGLVAPDDQAVGGTSPEVAGNKFPWHVAIFEEQEGLRGPFKVLKCGGSIVRSNVVITAAHCFTESVKVTPVNTTAYRVVAGTADPSYEARDPFRQEAQVAEVHLGEKYGGGARNWQADIAVVVLKEPLSASSAVRAVCLDVEDWDFNLWQTSPGIYGKVNGWGSAEAAQGLRITTVPVVSDRECNRRMPANYIMFISSDKICAGKKSGAGACPGDAGAGLVFPRARSPGSALAWYLRGVLSNAPRSTDLASPCSRSPLALYTNVFEHNIWISGLLASLPPPAKAVPAGPESITQRISARANFPRSSAARPPQYDFMLTTWSCRGCGRLRDVTPVTSLPYPAPYGGMP